MSHSQAPIRPASITVARRSSVALRRLSSLSRACSPPTRERCPPACRHNRDTRRRCCAAGPSQAYMLLPAIRASHELRSKLRACAHRLTRPLNRFGLPGRVLQPVLQSLFVVEGPCLDETRVDVPEDAGRISHENAHRDTPAQRTESFLAFGQPLFRPDVFDRKRGGSGQNLDNLLIVMRQERAARDSTGRTFPAPTCSRRK